MCGLFRLRLLLSVQGVWLLEGLLRSLELGPRFHFLRVTRLCQRHCFLGNALRLG
jgi:hypothetical protein